VLVIEQGFADLYFYQVTGSPPVDPLSTVSTTSDCLTAGTGAQAVIVVELDDPAGQPITGALVSMSSTVGSLGDVDSDGGTYWAGLTPPPFAFGSATLTVEANGTTLSAHPTVTILNPFLDSRGGSGGCPADGNVRVRVVDETGAPLGSAHVMIGTAEAPDLYQTEWNAAPGGDNTGLSDPDGYVEFVDLGPNLDGPLTLTAAADQRQYFTVVDVDAADLVLPLAPVYPDSTMGSLTGAVAPVPAPDNDPIEVAVVLDEFRLEALRSFSVDSLFGDAECYSAGGAAGDVPIQSNVYIPAQCAVQIIFCLQTLPEHPYTLPLTYGEHELQTLRGTAPLSVLSSGDLTELLKSATLDGIGLKAVEVATPGPTAQDLVVSNVLTPNVDCTVDNVPAFADTICIVGGDRDSAGGPGLLPGEGRLFLTGYGLKEAADVGPITDVTTVARVGDFNDIEYLAGAVAQYLDPTDPSIPPGTESGQTAVIDRSGADLSGGASLVFDDFFPIRLLGRLGRSFSLSPLPGVVHPAPDFTRATIDQVVTETYLVCGAPEQRTRTHTLWEIFAPGGADSWILPTPPPGWPREEPGGDLAGLIDPTITPEDDALRWKAETIHLGTLIGFDYDRFSLADAIRHLTHATSNDQDY
jgi:hypothetical protein